MKTGNLSYMLVFDDKQLDYLSSSKWGHSLRAKCLFHLIKTAAVESKEVVKKGFKANLAPASVEITDGELVSFLNCDRKTVARMIKEMNTLGFISSKRNNRTSIHQIKCLKGWCDGTYSLRLM